MNIVFTKSFVRDYRGLVTVLQEDLERRLALFFENQNHPDLKIRETADPRGIFEGRLGGNYTFTFQATPEAWIFRRLGVAEGAHKKHATP